MLSPQEEYNIKETECYQLAAHYIQPNDGYDWAEFKLNESECIIENLKRKGIGDSEAIETITAIFSHHEFKKHKNICISLKYVLGTYYFMLSKIRPDQADLGIKYFEELMDTLSPKHPNWGGLVFDLAVAYLETHTGDLHKNTVKAIELLNMVTTVIDAKRELLTWVMAQSLLSRAYLSDKLRPSYIKHSAIEKSLEASDRSVEGIVSNAPSETFIAEAYIVRIQILGEVHRTSQMDTIEKILDATRNAVFLFPKEKFPEIYSSILTVLRLGLIDIGISIDAYLEEFPDLESCQIPDRFIEEDDGKFFKAYELLKDEGSENRAEQIEECIQIFEGLIEKTDRKVNPMEWAKSKASLANAYAYRIHGETWENFEMSIKSHEDAIEAIHFEKDPVFCANCLIDLADSYLCYSKGNGSDNVEIAIGHLEQALIVIKQLSDDKKRRSLSLLSSAYHRRTRGNRLNNVSYAVKILDNARSHYAQKKADYSDPQYLTYSKLSADLFDLEKNANLSSFSVNKDQSLPDWGEIYRCLDTEIAKTDRINDSHKWCKQTLHLCEMMLHFGCAITEPLEESLINLLSLFMKLKERASKVYECTNSKGYIHEKNSSLQVLVKSSQMIYWLTFVQQNQVSYNAPQDCQNKLKILLGEAIYYMEVYYHSYPLQGYERFKVIHGLKLADLYIHSERYKDAVVIFLEVSQAAELYLAQSAEHSVEAEQVLINLDQFVENAPFAALEMGSPEKAWIFAESGRARILSETVKLSTLKELDQKCREQLFQWRKRVNELEKALASSVIVDKVTPLKELMATREKIGFALNQQLKKQKINTAYLKDLLNRCLAPQKCIVLLNYSQHGCSLLVAYFDSGTLNIVHKKIPNVLDVKVEMKSYVAGNVITFREASSSNLLRTSISSDLQSSLWDLFGKPLHDTLSGLNADLSNVVLIPQGVMASIPVSLAKKRGFTECLLDFYTLSHTPNLSLYEKSLKIEQQEMSKLNLLVVSNPSPSADSGLKPLKFADIESAIIESYFFGDKACYSGPDATLQNIKAALCNSQIWHFACHCDFNAQDPKDSALYLANGDRLTARLISELNLQQAPQYVVLSACSSGMVGTEILPNEFNGFINSLLGIGVKGVFVSLWNVYDESTCFLISKLYENLVMKNQSGAQALQSAQQWLRHLESSEIVQLAEDWNNNKILSDQEYENLKNNLSQDEKPYSHPEKWGAFIHYGT